MAPAGKSSMSATDKPEVTRRIIPGMDLTCCICHLPLLPPHLRKLPQPERARRVPLYNPFMSWHLHSWAPWPAPVGNHQPDGSQPLIWTAPLSPRGHVTVTRLPPGCAAMPGKKRLRIQWQAEITMQHRFQAALVGLILAGSLSHAADIRTIAGTGKPGHSGDGGPATAGELNNPYGLTIGPDGALYICEVDSNVIRRLDLKTQTLSTVVGNGQKGYSGDSGPALAASLNQPYEIRFDRAGNMYFAEMPNHVVRRVDAKTRIISTIAGTGSPGFSGDGGPASKAQLRQPHSIAIDPDGRWLYIADIGNHRIRRVDLETGLIDTFAGTGERKPTPDGASLDGAPLN